MTRSEPLPNQTPEAPMTFDLSPEIDQWTQALPREERLPIPADQLLASDWQGKYSYDRSYALVHLVQSQEHPRYFDIRVHSSTDVVEMRRPVLVDGVPLILSRMLRQVGLRATDLAWTSLAQAQRSQKPSRRTGDIVYFLSAGEFIKIGKATGSPTGRVSQLRTGCPFPITILATMPGGVIEEHALHRRFKHIQAHGEWFHAAPDLLAFIDGVAGEGQ